MKKLTAIVSGNVQKVGYRGRVVDIANAFGLKGMVENLLDGRVKIIAEGEEKKLEWFEDAINIKNTLIQVASIEKDYSSVGGSSTILASLCSRVRPTPGWTRQWFT